MAGGPIVRTTEIRHYEGRVTWYVVLSTIVAGMGGLLFGYDVGITGGVTSMDNFLQKFFPHVAAQAEHGAEEGADAYCTYSDVGLQMFTSSLFLAAAFAGLVGSYTTRKWGRIKTMLIGGICFMIGAVLTSAAYHLGQLVVGRVILGFGVGLATQSVPVYLSEMAPTHIRGMLNIMFQLSITIGILIAECINLGTQNMPGDKGWRTSLALAGLPAIILTLGGIMLPETPNSLLERGHDEKARRILVKIRGTENVDTEFEDIRIAAELATSVKTPWLNLCKKDYRPELVMAFFIPFLQQWTGINSIMFYAPIIFKTISKNGALLATVITGAVNVGTTFVSVALVDKVGRKPLFYEGGAQMIAAEIAMGLLMHQYFGGHTGDTVPHHIGIAIIAVVCIFVAGFAWSWGPLAWLVPSEVLSLETRSAGYALTTCMNFLMTFVVGQSFLSMMCAMRWGIFLFFAGWVFLMSLFIILFTPETKGIPLEEMHLVWRSHWAWKHWQADKDRRHARAANQPGTVEFEEYKVNEENNHTHAAITNGSHTLPKPV
ncbi:Sugar transport protein MST3 [Coccomyxa sp. Obi]|nr:Sugar transport protein MST3 [Coccomyxa sp. Obi]